MAITYDWKIETLEIEKSELDLSFLKLKKQEYLDKIYKILDTENDGWDENSAKNQLNELKSYRAKILEIENKIQNNTELIENIDEKILFYKDRKNKVKNIPLYKDTEEWINETLWSDTLYQYAKETNNKQLEKDIEQRNLTFDKYSNYLECMYKDLFSSIKKKNKETAETMKPPKVVILLPEWMSEQIKEELKGNREISAQDIESFLKKELKKNAWEIKLSHIKNAFKDKANIAQQYIRRLIINYPWFTIIDNSENKISALSTQSKRDKLISSILSESKENIYSTLKKNDLLDELCSLESIDNLNTRISHYIKLFEETGSKFSNKEDFSENLNNAICTHTHVQIEKEIQKLLTNIINESLYPYKTKKYWYLAYKLSSSCDNWRIVLYPNWEIFKICSHDEYERVISSQPPIEKRNNV